MLANFPSPVNDTSYKFIPGFLTSTRHFVGIFTKAADVWLDCVIIFTFQGNYSHIFHALYSIFKSACFLTKLEKKSNKISPASPP